MASRDRSPGGVAPNPFRRTGQDMIQRYLLTGAQGFIGRHMVSHLLCNSPQSTILGIGRSPRQDSFFNHSLSFGDRQVLAPLPDYLRAAVGPQYRYIPIDITSVDFAAAVRDFQIGRA